MWGWGYFVLQDILNICDRVLRIRGIFYLFKLILSTTYLFLTGFAENQKYHPIPKTLREVDVGFPRFSPSDDTF